MPIAVAALPFIAICLALFAWQLAKSWDYTLGPLLQGLADKIDSLHIRIPHVFTLRFGFLAAAIRTVEADARHAISAAIEPLTLPLTIALRAFANAAYYPVRELRHLAADVTQTLWQLRRVVVPAMIAAKVAWIPRHLAAIEARVEALATRVPVHIAHSVTNIVKPTVTRIVHESVTVVRPRIRTVERESGATLKRVDNLARRVAPAALAAAIVATVARSSFKWIRCSKVRKVGRAACGMNDDLLDALIADTLLVVGTISLVEFARGLQAGMDELTPQVRKFWGVK